MELLRRKRVIYGAGSRGARLPSRRPDPIGSPEKPLSGNQFEATFRDYARNAARPLSDAGVCGVLATIGRLGALADARELLTPFA
jgi:hypothetical protein